MFAYFHEKMTGALQVAVYLYYFCRSSCQRCSMKKGVLRNFTDFAGKHLCQSLFFNKVVGLRDSGTGVLL